MWVLKVVMYLLCSSRTSWCYACERSSLVKYLAPLSSKLISLTVGMSDTPNSLIWKSHIHTNSYVTILFGGCYNWLDPRRFLILWYSLNHILLFKFFESCFHFVSDMVWNPLLLESFWRNRFVYVQLYSSRFQFTKRIK